MIGQRISHYKVLEKLGEGGMGVVYKAEDTKLKRIVALKFLTPDLTKDQDAKERFFTEAQAAAALNHPNIITVYEIDEYEHQDPVSGLTINRVYLAMEFVDGENLKEKMASGPLEIDEVLRFARQMAKGLREAHQKGVIHRDIKSANIMLTEKNHVKIMDFGVARLKNQTGVTKAGTTLGTADYMSPEQAQGTEVDHRSDIWSFGVVLYEMVTGEIPFKGEYEQAVIYSILNEEPEPVSTLRTDVPPELERIISKTLAKYPEERYQSVGHLLDDIKKLKEESAPEVTLSKIETSPEITIKASRKSIIAAAVILAIAVLLAVFLFILKRKPEPEAPVIEPGGKPSLAVVYFENNSGDENLDNWRSAFSELLTIDLSQSRYIRVLRSDEIYSILKKLNLLEAKKYSAEDLKEIARKGRVNRILKGSYIKAGDNFLITATLINTDSGDTIRSLSVKAVGEKNIFTKVDDLTKKIKLDLNLSSHQVAADIDKEVGKITTNSPEAFKYYSEGIKYYHKGNNYRSIQSMEKATAIDPEFAMAYRTLSANWRILGYISKDKRYRQKAFKLSHRISERERYRIQGDFYCMSEKTYDKAIDALNKLLALYPDDWIGNNLLGLLYLWLEEWDKAIERFEVNIQNEVEAQYSYTNQAKAYVYKGLYEKAREVLENYLINFPGTGGIHRTLLFIYLCQGKYDLALAEADKVISLEPSHDYNFINKGLIYYLRGDFVKAEKEFRKNLGLKSKLARIYGRRALGALYLLHGRLEDAKKQIKQGVDLLTGIGQHADEHRLHSFLAYINLKSGNNNVALKEFDQALNRAIEFDRRHFQAYALSGKGLAYVEMRSMDKAKATAGELKKFIREGMNKKRIRFYYYLMGMIEFKRENFAAAIDYFKKAISLLNYQGVYPQITQGHELYIDSLALAYLKSGELENAKKEYERIITFPSGRVYYGDIYARAFYHLGKIYQQKDWKGKAIETYNRFIDLWKNCDPPFQPLVEDAKQQVKELEGKK
jgi:serine/threonine protein kinase/Tfp pilus assembly protein PilF